MTIREAFHTVTGVTEQHAAGAVAVHQHGNQLFSCSLVALIGGGQQGIGIGIADAFTQQSQRFWRQRFFIEQQRDRIGNWLILLLLFDEFFVIVETIRIEQTQARKVALLPELFRRCGQQQHAWDLL